MGAAQASLDAIIPSQAGQRSFCYPCYQTFVGTATDATHRSYIPLVAEKFVAARGAGPANTTFGPPHPARNGRRTPDLM